MSGTAALVLLCLAAQTASAQPPAVSDIRRLINAGEPAKALEALQKVPDGHAADTALQIELLRGVAYYQSGEPRLAVEALGPIVGRLAPGSIERREAEQVLGLSLFVMGNYADAVPRLEATREWAPGNLELAYALAQAYVHTQRTGKAREMLAFIYGVAADSAAAYLIAAQTLIRLEMEPLAEAELARAFERDPRLPHVNLLLGQIALFRGRLDEAATLTLRELDLNPANAMAFSQLGDAYVRQGKWDDAIAALRRSIWLNPYYSAPYILLGRAYLKKGEPATSEAMLRRAILYDPNNRAAHYLLAQTLQQLGRAEEAAREFELAERLETPRGR